MKTQTMYHNTNCLIGFLAGLAFVLLIAPWGLV
jgi:hypothetical protein